MFSIRCVYVFERCAVVMQDRNSFVTLEVAELADWLAERVAANADGGRTSNDKKWCIGLRRRNKNEDYCARWVQWRRKDSTVLFLANSKNMIKHPLKIHGFRNHKIFSMGLCFSHEQIHQEYDMFHSVGIASTCRKFYKLATSSIILLTLEMSEHLQREQI